MLQTGLFLISVVLFGVFFILVSSVLASRAYIAHQEVYQGFIYLQKEFIELQNLFIEESWYWPVKVRPVLYLTVDRWAQVLFANAQKEIMDAENAELEITPIPPPNSEPEKKFRLLVYANTVSQHYRVLFYISVYKNHIHNAQSILNELREEHLKVENLQIGVQAKVKKTNEDIERIESRLNTLKEISLSMYQNVEWAFSGAESCLFEAENQIDATRETSDDGLKYAIADTLQNTTEYFLEQINISILASEYFVQYELDLTNRLLEISQKLLTIVLRNHATQTWKMLVYVRTKYQALREIFKLATTSLQNFEIERKLFEQNKNQLKDIKFSEFVEQSISIEGECEIYWGSYREGKEHWELFLGNVLPPSRRLESCQESYQPIIESVLVGSKLIKQSELPKINNSILTFQNEVASINEEIEFLHQEYKRNYIADLKAHEMLSETGNLHQNLIALQGIVQDSSPDIQISFAEHWRTYEQYKQRANRKKWANFPELIKDIESLIENSEATLIEHHQLIASLQADYNQSMENLKSIFGELKIMMDKRPRIEWDWHSLFENYTSLMKYPKISDSYAILFQFIQDANIITNNAKEDMRVISSQWNEFWYQYNETDNNLKLAIQNLEQLSASIKTEWSAIWGLIKDDIEHIQQTYQALTLKWKNSHNEETIRESLILYNKIDLNIESLQKETRKIILDTKNEKRRLNGLLKAIHKMLEQHAHKIPEDIKQNVLNQCQIARTSEIIEEAESHLHLAYDYISHVVTSKASINIDVHGDMAGRDIYKPVTTRVDIGGISGTSGGQINIGGRDIYSNIISPSYDNY